MQAAGDSLRLDPTVCTFTAMLTSYIALVAEASHARGHWFKSSTVHQRIRRSRA